MDTHTMQTLGIIMVAIITAIIGPAILEFVKLRLNRAQEPDPIKEELNHSKVINDELDEIREHLKCDRVWIQMYHNGGHFLLTHKSIQKFSIMYESVKPGVSGISHILKNIPISLYSRSTEQIINEGHIYIEDYYDPKVPTYGLQSSAETTNTKSCYAFALFDIGTDKCIGVLGVDYVRKKKMKEENKQYLNERAQRVSGYLSNLLN